MFKTASPEGFREPFPGIRYRSLAHGAATHCVEFRLSAGSILPRHSHPHEQTGYLVSGTLRLTIGDELFEARPGDSWSIPGGMEHGGVAVTDVVAVEVFAPLRADYL